ncbi:MAG: MFS transporter [Micropruina sp.]|nr:MFS transporter [Micropruina sp.]
MTERAAVQDRNGTTEEAVNRRLEAAKVATSVSFLLAGWGFATFAGRIPAIRDSLGLDPAGLGLLLLAGAAGSIIGLPLAGKMSDRFGTATVVFAGALLSQLGLIAVGFTAGVVQSTVLTGVALFFVMFGVGQWDVAMNIEGAAVEHGLGRTIMPRYHAAFSLGTVACALAAAGAAALGVSIVWHFLGTAVIVAPLAWWATRQFLPVVATTETSAESGTPSEAANDSGRVRSPWTEPRTLMIGLVTLIAAFTEGAANDWIPVALIDGHHLPEWAGVMGLATFLGFMTMGRLAGTHLLDRYGRVPVLRVMLAMAGAGSLMVVFGNWWMAFIGAAVWGLGISLGFPTGISAAADDPRRAAVRVATVSTIAYFAFLVGPPALGLLGNQVGVLKALSVVSLLLVIGFFALPAFAKPSEVSVAPVVVEEDSALA